MAALFADQPDVREAEAHLTAAAGRIHLRLEVRVRLFDRVLGSAAEGRRWRPGRPRLLAAVAANCAALALVCWWGMPAVRARALVAAAQAGTPAAAGLSSLYMVSTELQRTRGGRACTLVVQVWWRAPDT